MKVLLRIEHPAYVAGAVFERSGGEWVCVRAAPILKWMLNAPIIRVERFAKKYNYSWWRITDARW